MNPSSPNAQDSIYYSLVYKCIWKTAVSPVIELSHLVWIVDLLFFLSFRFSPKALALIFKGFTVESANCCCRSVNTANHLLCINLSSKALSMNSVHVSTRAWRGTPSITKCKPSGISERFNRYVEWRIKSSAKMPCLLSFLCIPINDVSIFREHSTVIV